MAVAKKKSEPTIKDVVLDVLKKYKKMPNKHLEAIVAIETGKKPMSVTQTLTTLSKRGVIEKVKVNTKIFYKYKKAAA